MTTDNLFIIIYQLSTLYKNHCGYNEHAGLVAVKWRQENFIPGLREHHYMPPPPVKRYYVCAGQLYDTKSL